MADNKELIPQSELDILKKYNEELKKTNQELVALLPAIKSVDDILSKNAITYKELTAAAHKQAEAEEKHRKILTEKEKIQRKIEAESKKIAAASSNEAKELERLHQQLLKINQERRQEAREAIATAGSVEQLRAAYNRLYAQWAQMDQAAPDFDKVGQDVQELKSKLDAAEQSTGDYSRNVGNYASGFGSLNYEVQQIVRELPSLTVSLPQFFLAISNNLPMLADKIQQVKAAQKEATGETKKGPPVWKQVIQSLASWQTILVLGITVLTAYGKEIAGFFKELFTGKKTILSTAKALDNMNEAMNTNDIGSKMAEFKKLQKAWVDLGGDVVAQKKFLEDNREELNKTGIAINNISDAENIFQGNTDKYIESLKMRAMAEAGRKLAAEQYGKAMQEEARVEEKYAKDIAKYTTGIEEALERAKQQREQGLEGPAQMNELAARNMQFQLDKIYEERDALKQAGDAYFVLANKAEESAENISKLGGLQLIDEDAEEKAKKLQETILSIANAESKAYAEMLISRLNDSAENNKKIADDEKASYAERMAALGAFITQQKDAINQARENEKDALISDTMKETGKSRVEVEKLITNQLNHIDEDAARESIKIDEEGSKTRIAISESTSQKLIEGITERATTEAQAMQEANSKALAGLAKQYAEGEIKTEEYEKRKKALADLYAIDRYDAEQAMLQEQLNVLGLTEQEREAIEKKMAENSLKFEQQVTDQKIKEYEDQAKAKEASAKKEEEIEERLAAKRKELIMEVADLGMQLINNRLEAQLESLEKEGEANEEYYDEERDRIDRLYEGGAISKEEADARKALVDEQEAQREEELEAKKAEIRRKQAIAEKAMTIAQIGWSTAEAIMSIWAETPKFDFGVAAGAMTALVAALGAAQIANVLATPIPEYATGTRNHRGGLAIVGDGGRSELVYAGGAFFKTPDIPTLVDLPKHAQVFPDYERAIANMSLPDIKDTDQTPAVVVLKDDQMVELQRQSVDAINKFMKSYNAGRRESRYRDIISRANNKYKAN